MNPYEDGRSLQPGIEIIDTNEIIKNIDHDAWQDLLKNNYPLRPEYLARYFSPYANFAIDREIPLTYWNTFGSRGGINPNEIGVIGPSATGKDTLIDLVLQSNMCGDYAIAIGTATSRKPRDHEKPDAYAFTDQSTFAEWARNGELIEAVRQGNDCYGTREDSVFAALQTGASSLIWRGDVVGVPRMEQWCQAQRIPFVCIGILPGLPLSQSLDWVLKKRGQTDEWRAKKLKYEIQHMAEVADVILLNPPSYDEHGNPDPNLAAVNLASLIYRLTYIGA